MFELMVAIGLVFVLGLVGISVLLVRLVPKERPALKLLAVAAPTLVLVVAYAAGIISSGAEEETRTPTAI